MYKSTPDKVVQLTLQDKEDYLTEQYVEYNNNNHDYISYRDKSTCQSNNQHGGGDFISGVLGFLSKNIPHPEFLLILMRKWQRRRRLFLLRKERILTEHRRTISNHKHHCPRTIRWLRILFTHSDAVEWFHLEKYISEGILDNWLRKQSSISECVCLKVRSP